MIDFKKHEGPHGIPVYYQHLPMVESVSMQYLMFTGSADDSAAGTDGAYHWFEHIPFRGTADFPGGYEAIKGPFAPKYGKVGAWTSKWITCFSAYVHKSQMELAVRVITDLVSRPLLTDEAIADEREIIYEEIREQKSSPNKFATYNLFELLWSGHPLSHHPLGSIESLQRLDGATLRQAHQKGYAASRSVIIVAGDIEGFFPIFEKASRVIPLRNLTERRQPASHGPLPSWQSGVRSEIETDFPSSLVYMIFPRPAFLTSVYDFAAWKILSDLLDYGGSSSPLYRIVREEGKLAYSTGSWSSNNPDCGDFGVRVGTSLPKIELALEAIRRVLNDPVVRSPQRFETIIRGYEYRRLMIPVDPELFTTIARSRLIDFGKVLNNAELDELLRSIQHKDVLSLLDQCTPELARTIIFRGNGKG